MSDDKKTEKTAGLGYPCLGDCVYRKSDGKKGCIASYEKTDVTSEKYDDDGAKVRKEKRTTSITVKFDDGSTMTTDKPEEVLQDKWDYEREHDKGSEDAPAKAASAKVIGSDVAIDTLITALKQAAQKKATEAEKTADAKSDTRPGGSVLPAEFFVALRGSDAEKSKQAFDALCAVTPERKPG